jgi:hypothetical protein
VVSFRCSETDAEKRRADTEQESALISCQRIGKSACCNLLGQRISHAIVSRRDKRIAVIWHKLVSAEIVAAIAAGHWR